jgi:hypothetical protein
VFLQELDRRAREGRCHVAQLELETQVGLVAAVATLRFGVGQARNRLRQLVPERFAPHVDDALFHQRHHVVFIYERELDIELSEFGLPVGARILVAEAARDLHVAADAAHHQDLLEDLRGLRQRVKGAVVCPARHEKIARALGRRFDQDRRFDFDEIAFVEEIAHRFDDLVAHRQIVLQARPAQVEIAVLEPQAFVDLAVGVHRKGRHERVGEDVERLDREFDGAGRELRILGARRAQAHRAGHVRHVFVAQCLGLLERARLQRIEHDLRDAVAVAQIDEDQAAVIAPPVDPAVELDRRPDVARSELAARALSHVRAPMRP